MTRKDEQESSRTRRQGTPPGDDSGPQLPFPREMLEMMAGCCGSPEMKKMMAACMSKMNPDAASAEERKETDD